jgi:hypothetical protein
MTKTSREKRLFRLAESLAREVDAIRQPMQPEDLLSWLQCNVPFTEQEQDEDIEELPQPVQSRGMSAIQKLRSSLGYAPGDSLISVIEKAAEVCELDKSSQLPKTADGVPFFIGDTLFIPNNDREFFGPDPILSVKVDYISKGASFVEYRGDFTIGADGDIEGGNLDFYSTREACPEY